MKRIWLFIALFFTHSFLFWVCTAEADYIFAAPPRERNEMQAIKLYGPLVQKLTEILGEKVVYEPPDNWPDYAKKMRNDEYDIVFDGPHFNAWRMKHLHHIPVATLPGTLKFYLVTFKRYSEINTARDLGGRTICGMPSPHLATDMILDLYKNPSIQPIVYEVPGGIREMYQAFQGGECLATIFRAELFEKLEAEEKANLKIVARTKALPNQTLSISRRLSKDAHKISTFLISDEGVAAARKLLARYSKNARYFIRPSNDKFHGAEDVLEGVVFGW